MDTTARRLVSLPDRWSSSLGRSDSVDERLGLCLLSKAPGVTRTLRITNPDVISQMHYFRPTHRLFACMPAQVFEYSPLTQAADNDNDQVCDRDDRVLSGSDGTTVIGRR
jgi:hypothetical protein